ncbi:MAG: hypothetical protein MZW92_05210 [Comamonadaceae bacterium]|nr:hypothetical protein [Comamonadaceae bacterium]
MKTAAMPIHPGRRPDPGGSRVTTAPPVLAFRPRQHAARRAATHLSAHQPRDDRATSMRALLAWTRDERRARCACPYWRRYGATLLGLMRAPRAPTRAHFLRRNPTSSPTSNAWSSPSRALQRTCCAACPAPQDRLLQRAAATTFEAVLT